MIAAAKGALRASDNPPTSNADKRKALYIVAMLVASVGLSIVSFYTTFFGFANFLSFWFAIPTTFAVQTLMLVAAWQLGFALMRGGGKLGRVVSFLVIFVICFALSTFFSFSKLFDTVAGADHRERTQAAQLQSFYDEARSRLRGSLDERLFAAGQVAVQTDAFKTWKEGIDVAVEFMSTAPEEVRRAREIAAARHAEAAQRAGSLDADIKPATERAQRLRDELARVTQEFEATEKLFKTLEAERAFFEKEMQAQLVGKDGRPAGIGPKYRAAQAKRDAAVARLPDVEGRLTRLRVERDATQANYDTAAAALAELRGDLAEIAPRLADGNPAGGSGNADILLQADVGAEIRAAVDDFQVSFERADIDLAVEKCEAVKAGLAGIPATRARAEEITCASPGFFRAIEAVQEAASARAAFDAACPAAPTALAAETAPAAAAAAVLAGARACVAASEAPVELRRDVNGELENFAIAMDGGVQKFSSVLNAITSGNEDATLAFGVAVVIDLLVLICGLVGAGASTVDAGKQRKATAKPTAELVREAVRLAQRGPDADPADEAEALKLILRSTDRDPAVWGGKRRRCDVARTDGEPQPIVDHAIRILRHLTGAGLAKQARGRHADAPAFSITDDVIDRLQAMATTISHRARPNLYTLPTEDDLRA